MVTYKLIGAADVTIMHRQVCYQGYCAKAMAITKNIKNAKREYKMIDFIEFAELWE